MGDRCYWHHFYQVSWYNEMEMNLAAHSQQLAKLILQEPSPNASVRSLIVAFDWHPLSKTTDHCQVVWVLEQDWRLELFKSSILKVLHVFSHSRVECSPHEAAAGFTFCRFLVFERNQRIEKCLCLKNLASTLRLCAATMVFTVLLEILTWLDIAISPCWEILVLRLGIVEILFVLWLAVGST